MNKTHTLSHLLPVLGFFIMGFCDVVGVATSHVQQHFALGKPCGLIPLDGLPVVPKRWPCRWLSDEPHRPPPHGDRATSFHDRRHAQFAAGGLLPFAAQLIAFAPLASATRSCRCQAQPTADERRRRTRSLPSSSLTAGQVIKAVSSFSGPSSLNSPPRRWAIGSGCTPIRRGVADLGTVAAGNPIQESLTNGRRRWARAGAPRPEDPAALPRHRRYRGHRRRAEHAGPGTAGSNGAACPRKRGLRVERSLLLPRDRGIHGNAAADPPPTDLLLLPHPAGTAVLGALYFAQSRYAILIAPGRRIRLSIFAVIYSRAQAYAGPAPTKSRD